MRVGTCFNFLRNTKEVFNCNENKVISNKFFDTMESKENKMVFVSAEINAPVEKVWKFWTTPDDIIQWNSASDDWHTLRAENDLRVGGKFNARMEAKDGSMGFDFEGEYVNVIINQKIEYVLGDGRKVKVVFTVLSDRTEVVETFETENKNPIQMQRDGWQAILDNFKKYVEANKQ